MRVQQVTLPASQDPWAFLITHSKSVLPSLEPSRWLNQVSHLTKKKLSTLRPFGVISHHLAPLSINWFQVAHTCFRECKFYFSWSLSSLHPYRATITILDIMSPLSFDEKCKDQKLIQDHKRERDHKYKWAHGEAIIMAGRLNRRPAKVNKALHPE